MPTKRALDVFETFKRFNEGVRVKEDSWDYAVVPNNAHLMKEKYNISFDGKVIPEDRDLCKRLFAAGFDMLVTCGYYNNVLGRVMTVDEDEVLEGIRRAPRRLIFGEGRESVECISRHGNAHRTPIIEAGPTGAPVSEDIFSKMIQSYVQEPLVDTIVSGVMESVCGEAAATNTPMEIRATLAEIRQVREACCMCGRPGMGI